MSPKSWTVGMMIPLAAATVVSAAPSATALTPSAPVAGTAAQVIGVCSGRSTAELTARTNVRDQIVLNFRVFTNRAGETWRVRITQNGAAIANETAFTRPARGVRPPARRAASLAVREVADNMRGIDRFVVRATNPRSGETCTARIQVREDRERL